MRRPYDHRLGRTKERDRTRVHPGVIRGRGKFSKPSHAARLTLSLECGIEPPSNAASGQSAGTGHDAQRDSYPHRKGTRRHSPPPPAESPAHFCFIARFRRGHIRLGSLGRVPIPVPGMAPRGTAASRFAVASHQPSDSPSPGPSYWFVGSEGNGHTNSGRIPTGAS